QFHRLRRVRGGADAGVEHDRDRAARADQLDRSRVGDTHAGADQGPERHHHGAADIGEFLAGDRVLITIGQHDEALAQEYFGGVPAMISWSSMAMVLLVPNLTRPEPHPPKPHPPCSGRTISILSPAASAVARQSARRTTAPLTATARNRTAGSMPRSARSSA